MISIALPHDSSKVLCGFDNGSAMRKQLQLSYLEKKDTVQLIIRPDLYTVSGSYIHGLVQKNPDNYSLYCEDKKIQEILNMHLHLLRTRHAFSKKPSVKQRFQAALKAFKRGY